MFTSGAPIKLEAYEYKLQLSHITFKPLQELVEWDDVLAAAVANATPRGPGMRGSYGIMGEGSTGKLSGGLPEPVHDVVQKAQREMPLKVSSAAQEPLPCSLCSLCRCQLHLTACLLQNPTPHAYVGAMCWPSGDGLLVTYHGVCAPPLSGVCRGRQRQV
jgi:hypothetical protein